MPPSARHALGTLAVIVCLTPVSVAAQAFEPLLNWQVAKAGTTVRTAVDVTRIEGRHGWVRSKRGFNDLVLRMDFRLVTPDTEAAVIVRAWSDETDTWPKAGYRVSLTGAHSANQFLGRLTGISKRVVGAAGTAAAPRVGEWQRLEVRCEGNEVTVSIDGAAVQQGEGREIQAGQVGVELFRGAIEFRNVAVQPLAPAALAGVLEPDTPGLVDPAVIRSQMPRYTADALDRQVTGVARLQVVITADGSVGAVYVTDSLIPDLDAEAVAAARQWKFRPARLNGQAVAVKATIEMQFRLGR